MSTQQRSWNTTEVCDRRTSVRRPVYLLCYISLGEKNGGVLRDISEGGLALQAAEELTGDDSLRLCFRLPKSREWIETDAKIIWRGQSKRECGIKFVELAESARCEIERWLAEDAPSVRANAKEQRSDSDLFSAAEPGQSPLRENPPASRNHHRANQELGNQASARSDTQVAPGKLYGPPEERPGAKQESHAARLQTSLSMQPERGPAPDERYDQPRFEGAGYWTGKETHRKSRGWGFALGLVGTSFALALGGVVALGPATLRDEITRQVAFLSSVASREIADLEGTGTTPTAPASAPTDDANSPLNSPASSAPTPIVHGDTLPANQNPAAALALKNTLPFELQPQPEVAAPRPPQSSREKSQLHREPKSPAREAQSRKPSLTNVTYRMKSSSLKPQSSSRTPGQVVQSPPASRQLLSTPAPADDSGSYRPGGFLDLPGMPVSASGAIAITSHRTIPIPAGPVSQPDSGQSLKIGSLVYHVDPIYPAEALRERVEGTVELHLAIGPEGNVENVEPVSGPELLIQAAMSAARQWQYGRTLHYGNPIPTEDEVTVVFRLP